MRARNLRRVLLGVDVVFGMLLLAAAFGPTLLNAANRPAQALPAPTARLVLRLGGIAQPGQPIGFATAVDGSLGIVDRSRGVVMHVSPTGTLLAEWGPRFGGGLDAQDLVGLAAAPDGWYVLDRGAGRVLRLDSSGKVQPERTIDLQPLAPYGPNSLAVDGRGKLYVADTGRDRILVFEDTGQLASTVGESGRDLGQFKQPMSMAFARDGSLFVADLENRRVDRWAPQLQNPGAWELPSPAANLAVDAMNRVYVPDFDQRMVRAFGPDGTLLFQLGGSDAAVPLPVGTPLHVAVSPDDKTLWVLGTEGLSSIDLQPFATAQPTDSAARVRWPLAIGGVLVLVVAGVLIVGRPSAFSWAPTFSPAPARAPLTEPMTTAVAPRWFATTPRWLRLPARRALLAGGVLFGFGFVAMVVAELRLLDPLAQADPWPRMAGLVVASLVSAFGIALTVQAVPLVLVSDWPADRVEALRAGRRAWVIVPAVFLALVAAVIWWQQRFNTSDATRGVLVWIVALVLVVIAIWGAWTWRLPPLSLSTAIPWLLFALALLPRIWNQADLPYGIWFDEADSVLQGRRLIQEGHYTPITDAYGDTSLFYYLVAAVNQLVRDPILAVRTPAAVIGALNAPLVYFLGRELWGWRVGLAAGVLLALGRWHLDISRIGMFTIMAPVFATLAFWLLARAVRTRRLSDALWAGLAFGAGLHGYFAFRTLPVVAVVLIVYAALLYRWRPRTAAGSGAALLGGFLLVALPLLIFSVQDPTSFNGRMTQTLIFTQEGTTAQKLADVWSNVQKHALMFHVHGDMNGRHNLPGWPMLDPFSAALATLGLAWLVIHLFDWRGWLIFGWGIVAMSGGVFTLPFEAPQAFRTVAVTPVLALLVGLALLLVADRLSFGRWYMQMTALSVVVAFGIGALNVHTFFTRQMQDPAVWESFSTRETILMRTALEGQYAAILGSPTMAPSVESALLPPAQRDRIRAFDPTTDLPYRGAGPALIVLETEHDAALVDEVMRFYPGARRVPIQHPDAAQPLVEEVVLDSDLLASQYGFAPRGDGAWQALLAVDAGGAYRIAAPSGMQVSVDGAQPANTVQMDLVRGNHVLDVRGYLMPGQLPELTWQPPNEGDPRPIDPRALFRPPEGGTGLAVTLFPAQGFDGAPRDQFIDPMLAHYFHVNPFRHVNFDPHNSWSAEWVGRIDVPASGAYRFEAVRASRAGVWIDDRPVFDDTRDSAPEQTSGVVELTEGLHQIRVRFQDRSEGGPRIYLYWTPPGGAREVIPGSALYAPTPPAQ